MQPQIFGFLLGRLAAILRTSFSTHFFREYPCIDTRQEADSYKEKCELDYKRYTELKKKLAESDARFERYQKEVTKMNRGTPEFQRMYRLIVDDYREECNKGFLSNKREYDELILRPGFNF